MRCLSLALVAVLAASAGAADFPPADKLPMHKELPDPLTTLAGRKVRTADGWLEKRRPELKRLFQHYMYGQLPAAPAKVEATVEHEDTKALGGKALLREISLSVAPAPAPKIHLLLVIPKTRPGPAPVFVGMNFSGNHTLVDDPKVRLPDAWMYDRQPGVKKNRATEAGRGQARDVWALDQAVARGYAVCTFYNGDVDPDRKEVRGGLKPYIDKAGKAGTIAAWAWGIHRAVDYLVGVPELDRKRIAVVGHSRLGKTALLAAAFDERIALAIPHQAGCGGTAPSRDWIGGLPPGKVETVKRINTSFPHWFNDEFKKFNDDPARLPFDQNGLAALVAPRPVLFSNATEDLWANPPGQFEVLKAAQGVYRLLGAGTLATSEMPKVGVLSAGTLGYYIRAGKHSMTREDWKVFLDFADRHLGKPGKKSSARARSGKKLLLVGQGADGHPPQTHEYMAGLRVLKALLEGAGGVEVTTVRAHGKWEEGPELIERSDGVVLFLAEGAAWLGRDARRAAALRRLQARGGGLVTLHWAMGAREAAPVKDFVDLFGGCHGGPDRKYKVLRTTARVAGKHEATRGLADFEVKDEFYYRLKFPPSAAKGTLEPLLKVKIDGEEHTVAWAYRPARGGRAFGFSGLHFHDNWKLPQYRRLVAQGVLWSLGLGVPEAGLDVTVDDRVLALP